MPLLILAGAAVFVFLFNKQKGAAGAAPGAQPGAADFTGLEAPAGSAAEQAAAANRNAGLAVAGAVGGAVSGVLASLGYLTTAGPIGAAIAGAIAVIVLLRGTTHLVANDFVNNIQNPFGRYLADIVDENDRLMRIGQQTPAGAADAHYAVSVLWSEFQAAGEDFARRNTSHQTVYNQALQELDGPRPAHNPPFFMTLVLANIERDVTDLETGRTPRAR